MPKILSISVHRPETRCVVKTEGGHELVSQVGSHYQLDVKGPYSRISSRIHTLLGGSDHEEQILTAELTRELLNSFSERHAGARMMFERFLDEHYGSTISCYYAELGYGPTIEERSRFSTDAVPLFSD